MTIFDNSFFSSSKQEGMRNVLKIKKLAQIIRLVIAKRTTNYSLGPTKLLVILFF